MKILITGNAGFIFSHVTEYFLERGHEVVGIDALYDGSHKELIPIWQEKYTNLKQYTGDVNTIRYVLESQEFDVIIHAAAESNVDKSVHDRAPFIESNIIGTKSVLEYALKYPPKVFVNIDTDEVFGSVIGSANESTKFSPSNLYSASKAAASMLCSGYAKTYGLNIKEVHMCNIIGKRQADTKLIPRVIKLLKENKPIPVYDGGTATREYLDVRDVAPLIERVINDGDPVNMFTFNQELSILQVIATITALMDKIPQLEMATRLGHDMRYSMMPSSVCDGYNFIPFTETIKWMLSGTDLI